MIIKERQYLEWLELKGVGKKDKVASSTKSYISYLNSVSKIINQDISPEILFDENCILKIEKRILEIGKNTSSISKYKTAMRQYVNMVKSGNHVVQIEENKKVALSINKSIPQKNIKSSQKLDKYKSIFKMPTPVSIMGRSSSITNSFINGIIPLIEPSDEEIEEVLTIFNLSADNINCVYCGDNSTEWDHLFPLIKNKKFTGYISEIQNLVPACGKCNQSKGNTNWFDWMNGNAKQSPFSRGIEDIDERIKRIRIFENWKKKTIIDFEELVGDAKWKEYTKSYDLIIETMKYCQSISNDIKQIIKLNYESVK